MPFKIVLIEAPKSVTTETLLLKHFRPHLHRRLPPALKHHLQGLEDHVLLDNHSPLSKRIVEQQGVSRFCHLRPKDKTPRGSSQGVPGRAFPALEQAF